jgi:hypothetical protein
MLSFPRLFLLFVLCFTATTAPAQSPPDPLPLGVPYVYQYGNQYYSFSSPGRATNYAYPSSFPYGASWPVYGRYSWDSNVYFAAGVGWYATNMPSYPYPLYQSPTYYLQYPYPYPTYTYNRAWQGFGW